MVSPMLTIRLQQFQLDPGSLLTLFGHPLRSSFG